MTLFTVSRRLPTVPGWVIVLLLVCTTGALADPIVFTNGDASHLVNGQAINTVREGSLFTLSGADTLTSMDFNFFTSATTVMDSVSWWIYSSDPATLVSPSAQGNASVESTFLRNLLIGNYYADYTGTITLPDISLAPGSYYIVLGDATKGGSSVTTYWGDDSTTSGTSVFWNSAPNDPNGIWYDRTEDYVFDLRGTAGVPEPATGTLLICALPLVLPVRRRARAFSKTYRVPTARDERMSSTASTATWSSRSSV